VLWLPTAGRESDDEPPVCDTWCLFIFKVNGKTKSLINYRTRWNEETSPFFLN
jgi:hypothetical protein